MAVYPQHVFIAISTACASFSKYSFTSGASLSMAGADLRAHALAELGRGTSEIKSKHW